MESKNKTGFFTALISELKNLLKNPKKLIPTFVLCGIWLVFSLMSGFGANIPALRFLYTLTYANGGMFGGFFGTVGGIFGKAVFAAVVNTIVLSICEKRNPFSGLGKGLKGTFTGSLFAVAPLFIGGGLGVLLYWFFNITSSPVNCAVSVVAAIGALSAIGKKNGLLFSLIFGAMRKLSGGKTPSLTAVNRVITGFSLGFALAFPITFIRFPLLLFLMGLVLLIGGIVLVIVGKNGSKRIAATTAIMLIVGASLMPAFTVNVFAAELPEGFVNPVSEFDFPERAGGSDIESIFYKSGVDRFYIVPEKVSYEISQSYFAEGGNQTLMFDASCDPFTIVSGIDNQYRFTAETSFSALPLVPWDHHVPAGFDTDISFGDFRIKNEKSTNEEYEGFCYITYGTGTSSTCTYYFNNIDDKTGAVTEQYTTDGEPYNVGSETKMSFEVLDGKLYVTFHLSNTYYWEVAGVHYSGAKPAPSGSGSEEDIDDSDYIPYRGRLTYNNGRTNKYGQPFPDLMDFDMDGDIDYADRVLQHELVHNPDYLDQPGSPAAIAAIAILTVLLGGGGAIFGAAAVSAVGSAAAEVLGGTVAEAVGEVAGEAVGSAVSGIDDLGPHINRDADGDLNVTDPATGEKRLYKNNGDGTYTNPLTGATYTEAELKSSLESREENASTIRQDAAAANEAIAAQREDNQGLSDYAKEYAEEKAEQASHDEYVEKLGEKYGVHSGDEDDIRAKIGYEQGKAEIEFYENTELESEYKNKQEYVETVEKAADTSIDVLADVTGRKDIKAAYTMAKNTVARTTEAYVNDKNVMVGMAQGAIEGTIDVIKDNVDGAGNKLVANVVGETYKDAMNATINGKDMTEAVVGGIGKGLVNTGVDVGMDLVGDGVKGMMGDAAEDAIKNAVTKGAEVTKGSLADGAKTLAGDLVKDGLDEAFKAPGEE